MFESAGYALVIGGTGMLRPAVHQLLERGLRVAAVARHPDRAAPEGPLSEQFIPVVADWGDPVGLADAAHFATNGQRATHLIVWAHFPHREELMNHLERLTAPDAQVVNVWGSAGKDPRDALARQGNVMPGRIVSDVVLGYIQEAGTSRWLTHAEISRGVLKAIDQPHDTHLVGQIDPWDQRP